MLHQAGETSASVAGIVIAGFGVGGALYALSVSRLLKSLGETWMMRAGGAVMGLCLVVIALRAPWPAQLADFVFLGFGFYMLHAVIQIYASELAPAARGSAMALHSFFFFLGQAAGPVLYGVGLNSIGLNPVMYFGAVVLLGTGLVCGQRLRRPQEASV
jgi:predicted MFS family arabinose efflux permease